MILKKYDNHRNHDKYLYWLVEMIASKNMKMRMMEHGENDGVDDEEVDLCSFGLAWLSIVNYLLDIGWWIEYQHIFRLIQHPMGHSPPRHMHQGGGV